MSKIEIYKCSNCKEQLENGYLHINSGLVRRSNGKKRGRSMGVFDLKMENQTFCTDVCLRDWLANKSDIGEFGTRGDLYHFGEQVGVDSPQGDLGK